jgi:nucleoside-diphosphate-sugar epimerase
MKKVLVTGSHGYLGSVLTGYLAKRNYEVLGMDTGFFKNCLLYPSEDPPTIYKDIRNINDRDLRNVDSVVHLAGISNDPLKKLKPEEIYDPVRSYSLKLANMCKEKGIQFIFPSSCSVYGKGDGTVFSEDSTTFPQTPYSINKLQIESDLKEISDGKFSPVMLRFATAFGPSARMRFDLVINMFVSMALTKNKIILNSDGKAWRPHVHVNDICKAIKYSIDYSDKIDRALTLNVGDNNNNYQIVDIAKTVQNEIPDAEISFMNKSHINESKENLDLIRDRKIQDGVDTRTYSVSFNKIKKVYRGFNCEYSVPKGISQMISRFTEIGLSETDFQNMDYYRLQTLEYLVEKGCLLNNLMWA